MKKNKITGLIGTAVLHILLLILLLVIAIRRPQVQEEGGVPHCSKSGYASKKFTSSLA